MRHLSEVMGSVVGVPHQVGRSLNQQGEFLMNNSSLCGYLDDQSAKRHALIGGRSGDGYDVLVCNLVTCCSGDVDAVTRLHTHDAEWSIAGTPEAHVHRLRARPEQYDGRLSHDGWQDVSVQFDRKWRQGSLSIPKRKVEPGDEWSRVNIGRIQSYSNFACT